MIGFIDKAEDWLLRVALGKGARAAGMTGAALVGKALGSAAVGAGLNWLGGHGVSVAVNLDPDLVAGAIATGLVGLAEIIRNRIKFALGS